MSIQEVPETEADETIQAIYNGVKSTLCVTYVPAFFRALATNEAFFRQMWASLEPTLTVYFERAADDLRASAVDLAHPLGDGLELPEEQRDQLVDALWVIHFVAPKTLLIATSLEEALSSGTTGAASRVVWPQNKGVPRGMPRPNFANPDDVDEADGIYREIQEALDLPTVSDEWRALGVSTEALQRAWSRIRDLSGGEAYSQAVDELTNAARERGQKLPRRVLDLDPDTLRDQGVDDDAQQRIRETVSAFVPALARETIHTALWLSYIASPAETKLSGLALIRRWTVPHGYQTTTVLA